MDKKDRSAEDIPVFLAGKNSLLDQITDYVKANLAEKLTLKMVHLSIIC